MKRILLVAALSAVPVAGLSEPAPTYPHELEAISSHAYQLLQTDAFSELETWATTLREEKAKLPSGKWELGAFYVGVYRPATRPAPETEWRTRVQHLERWRESRPGSITADVALAHLYIDYALAARGGTYAGLVKEQQWKLFQRRLKRAGDILDEAWKRSPSCPEYYAARVKLSALNKDGKEAMLQWCNRGLELEPSYPQIYEQAAWFLQDKWLGDGNAEWLTFAEACMEHAPDAYARIVHQLVFSGHEIACDEGLFETGGLSYELVQESYGVLVDRHAAEPAYRQEYCRLATLAGDRPTAAQLFSGLPPTADDSVWLSQQHYDLWRGWAGE